jgi:hypothetical protein
MTNRSRKTKAAKKKPVRAAGARKVPHFNPNRAARGVKAALMKIPAPRAMPWILTADEISLVKNHIAKGSTDEELKFCLAVARRFKLDPFRGQIWFVKRRDKTAVGGYKWIPITGINGLLHLAARDHPRDFGSMDEPEYGPLVDVTYNKNGDGPTKTIKAPEWAKVAAWKKGADRPTVAIVYWEEIYPNIDYAPMVQQMPRHMLGKCAAAHATRKAYPATDGLYIPEEFQGPPEYSPTGRELVLNSGEKTPTEKQQDIAKEKIKNAAVKAPTPRAEMEGAFLYYESAGPGKWKIDGTHSLKKEHRVALLGKRNEYWDPVLGAIIVDDDRLEGLKYELSKCDPPVPFRYLKPAAAAPREPGE